MEKIRKALAYPPSILNYALEKIVFAPANPLWWISARRNGFGVKPEINTVTSKQNTTIDEFWSENTVYVPAMRSALQSRLTIGGGSRSIQCSGSCPGCMAIMPAK